MAEKSKSTPKAVFRKLMGKGKKGGVKIKSDKNGTNPVITIESEKEEALTAPVPPAQKDAQVEELERKKKEWQDELGEFSDFLTLKSNQEQKDEGVQHPVDTAWIEEVDGMPMLKALFDVKNFTEEEVEIKVEDDQLILNANKVEIRDEEREYKQAVVRKLDLPKHADHRVMTTRMEDGLMHIEMPFHLPPKKQPQGPNVFPIAVDEEGRRRIQIIIFIGSDFTGDDVSVECEESNLHIEAAYDEEIGRYGKQVTKREFKRDYKLPPHLRADYATSVLAPDGRLLIEIYLKDEKSFIKTKVEVEEVNSDNDDDLTSNGDTSSVCPSSIDVPVHDDPMEGCSNVNGTHQSSEDAASVLTSDGD